MLEHGMLRGTTSSGLSTIGKLDIFNDGSCKALYRLDGNANDESGNYHGTETAITYGGGEYERCAVFAGASLVENSALTILSTGTWSYSLWITPSDVSSNVRVPIFTYAGYLGINSGVVGVSFRDSINYKGTSPTFNMVNNITYHVVITGTASTVTSYVNGVLTGTGSVVGGYVNFGTVPFRLGGTGGGSNANYVGNIDQVRIFNRAITAAEVTQLYAEVEPTSIINDTNPFQDGSCKALYKFENDANNATGVYNGTATNVTYSTGKFGQCAVFYASSLVSTVTSSIPNFSNVSQFSVSMWVKLNVTQANAGQGTILSQGIVSGTEFFIDTLGGGRMRITTGSTVRNLTFTSTINDNTWQLLTLTYDGTFIRVYKNANANGSVVATGVTGTLVGNAIFGDRYDGIYNYYLQGSIDQLRVFNKALTPLEIASLYNETTPLENPMSHQVDPFKDGSGKALYRLEGNALDESGKYNGTASSITYGVSATGREAIFNGSASITATLTLSTNTFSYSVWATVTTVSSTIQSLIDFSTGRAMLSSGNATNAYVSYYDGTSYKVFSAYALTSATRTHIGLAVNGTSVELFINGVSQGTSTCNAVTPSGTIAFGKYAGSAAGYLTGKEDQPRVFNRVLSASEFQQLYTNQA